MSSRTFTSLFNTYRLRDEINSLADRLETDSFDEAEMEQIEKSLYKLRDEFEKIQQPLND